MGALLLAIIAGVVPVLPSSVQETVHAQEATRPDDATLAAANGLSFTPTVNLSPTYARTETEYTARVANSVTVVTVAATTNNPDASANISPGDADSSAEGHQIALQAGRNNRITISVLAENRIARQTYTVMLYRMRSTPSDNANLSALGLTGVSLSPGFTAATAAYNARVAYNVEDVTVMATAADVGAQRPVVTTDPGTVDTAATGRVVTLAVRGANTTITVTVTAEDTSTKPYTITVYRESGPVLSPVSTLNSLTLTGPTLDPTFAAGTTEYTTRAENATESVTIAAAAAGAPGATVSIMPSDQDTSETATGHQVYLTPGTNTTITVTVTAENRSTNTYTIVVYRVRDTASDNANLSALSLDGVSLSPAFDPETMAYDARVAYNVTMATVMATAADIGAEGVVVTASPGSVDTAATGRVVTLGDLGVDTVITVEVTAEDDSTEAYVITVYRESGPVLDADTTLATFTAEPATIAQVGTTNEYTARATNVQGSVTIVATPTDAAGAMVDIMPADQDSLTEGHQVYLTAGTHTEITVTVTAENGTTDTYTIMAYRIRATASTEDTLSALSLDGVDISPEFDSETMAYDARVRYDVDEVTVERTAADIGASIAITTDSTGASVDGNEVTLAAQGADTVITVTVTAEDTTMSETYVITVYRENIVLSDIATLATLTVEPVSITLAAGTTEYTARSTAAQNVVTVAATPSDDPGARVEIMPADQNTLTPDHQVHLTSAMHTEITVTVTAENGSTNTYTVTIYRPRTVPSTDATLSALSLSGAVLSPAFDSARETYTATAAYGTDITTVMATANDIGAMPVVIEAVPTTALVTAGGNQVTLSDRGATRINVTVTAEDGTANMVYMLTVYRDAEPSSDATLQTLSLSGLTLSPAFDPATMAYTAEVEALDTTMVEAMATHDGATVEGTGEMSLTVGENMINVTVTAEDGTTMMTYTVTVTVAMGDTLLGTYDTNNNNRIDKDEALVAINDYLFERTITKEQALEIINLYLFP